MNIKKILPILEWLPKYNKQLFRGDLSAGITVGIMLIPQGMAYAMLAGLPPIYGLYASMIPQLVYAFLGTSRQLGVGPVAMDSLLVAVSVSQFAQVDSEQYLALAILLALMVGSIQLLMGGLRLGFLVNFLSHPVISGFTSAAALIIGFSQLKYLLGVKLSNSQYLHEILWSAFQELGNINYYTFALGLIGIIIIIAVQRTKSKIPVPLLVVIFGIVAVWGLGLNNYGVSIVEEVPSGLPSFSIPSLDIENILKLASSAVTIALVAFMEAIAVSKAIQARHKDYNIDANQELIALGMSNIGGSFFQGFPVTGGFSRSAVNDQAGAKTNMAAIISAIFVMLTLLFLTPLFYYLPKAVLASIIMVAVFKLISVSDARELWTNGHKRDFFILIITFIATLTIGIQLGILIGVVVSIMKTLYDTMYPQILFNDTSVDLPSNVLLVRYEEQLYFANSSYFVDEITAVLEGSKKIKNIDINKVDHLIIDGSYIPRIDSTGQKALESLKSLCNDKGLELSFVQLSYLKQLPSPNYQYIEDVLEGKQKNALIANSTL